MRYSILYPLATSVRTSVRIVCHHYHRHRRLVYEIVSYHHYVSRFIYYMYSSLDVKLRGMKEKKKDLQQQVEDCGTRISRAETLISQLGGEKERWTQTAKSLGETYTNLLGDMVSLESSFCFSCI